MVFFLTFAPLFDILAPYSRLFARMTPIDISNLEYADLVKKADAGISDFGNFHCTLVFKADYNQSKMIRDLILHLFEKNHIDIPWKSRFALVSDELVNNSIEYGSLPLDKNEFHIIFRSDKTSLTVNIEVTDTGRGPEAKTSGQMSDLRAFKESMGFNGYLEKRGRGLFQMVTNIVDDLYFRDNPQGGLTVGVTKKLELT